MDPKRDVEYLSYLAERLAEFAERFKEFMSLHEENLSFARGTMPAVFAKEKASRAKIAGLTEELNHLAGTLMDLSQVTDVRYGVQGSGVIDPFVNWATITQPKPLLEASNVRGACNQAAGRIESLLARAKALAAPSLDPLGFHPLVWSAAQRLWNDGHPREAVRAAAETVSLNMKRLTDRSDADDTSLWQQAFSDKPPEPGKPRLRWKGDPTNLNVKNMNAGLRQFAPGVQMTIRNPATHLAEDVEEQESLERLAVLSVLMRFLDGCDLVKVARDTGSEPPTAVLAGS